MYEDAEMRVFLTRISVLLNCNFTLSDLVGYYFALGKGS